MTLAALIKNGGLERVATATVATVATVKQKAGPKVAGVAGIAVAETPEAGARRQRVLAMLDRSPGIKHALITDTRADPEEVILTVGIRDLGTAELRIPKARYDAFAIMKAVETLQ